MSQSHSSLSEAFEAYVRYYFEGEMGNGVLGLFSEGGTAVGNESGAVDDRWTESPSQLKRRLGTTGRRFDLKFRELETKLSPGGFGVGTGSVDVEIKLGRQLVLIEGVQISTVFRKCGDAWKLVSKNILVPGEAPAGAERDAFVSRATRSGAKHAEQ